MFGRVMLTDEEEKRLSEGILEILRVRGTKGYVVHLSPLFVTSGFATLLTYAAAGRSGARIRYEELRFVGGRNDLKTPRQQRIVHRKLRKVIRRLFKEGEIYSEFLGETGVILPEMGEVSPHRIRIK